MAILIGRAKLAWAVIQVHQRAFVALNVAYFGLVLAGMGVAALFPAVQDDLLASAGKEVTSGPFAVVGEAYSNGKVLTAIVLTFFVNLFVGSIAWITIPSMIVPFLGIALGAYRAVLWGLLFYPGHPHMGTRIIPHLLTLVLEGEGYIVAMLAAWIHARAWMWPRSVGVDGRRRGYVEGLKRTVWLYMLVAAILLVAAVYEAIEVIWLMPKK